MAEEFNTIEDFDKVAEGAKRELRAIGEALIRKKNERKRAIPIINKYFTRSVALPQPLATLACAGMIDILDVSYLGEWEKGEVFIVYAEEKNEETKDNLRWEELYYNATMFGSLEDSLVVDGYIGFIKIGNNTIKKNKALFVNIVGAELLDEPMDDKPRNVSLCKTHVAKYRNIFLDDDIIKIPLSEAAWEEIAIDNFITFYWEDKFEGFGFIDSRRYNYYFYSDKIQRYFSPINPIVENETIDEEDDNENDNPIILGKLNNDSKVIRFDFSKLKETNGPKNKQSSFDILQKKDWFLDWNCVNFKNGLIIIYPPSDGTVNFKPKGLSVPDSLESFNFLKEFLNSRLSPVRCSVEKLELTIIDKINLNEAIEKFRSYAKQRRINVGEAQKNKRIAPQQLSFNQALSKAKQMTPEEFRKYKSKYIDFLITKQSDKYKVIPCVERLTHTDGDTTEYAFLFSIQGPANHILIVHENINPDRSTLLFLVKEEDYNNSIREIYDFMQSPETNKRSSLRERNIEISSEGIIHYRSINHDDINTWKNWIKIYGK